MTYVNLTNCFYDNNYAEGIGTMSIIDYMGNVYIKNLTV